MKKLLHFVLSVLLVAGLAPTVAAMPCCASSPMPLSSMSAMPMTHLQSIPESATVARAEATPVRNTPSESCQPVGACMSFLRETSAMEMQPSASCEQAVCVTGARIDFSLNALPLSGNGQIALTPFSVPIYRLQPAASSVEAAAGLGYRRTVLPSLNLSIRV